MVIECETIIRIKFYSNFEMFCSSCIVCTVVIPQCSLLTQHGLRRFAPSPRKTWCTSKKFRCCNYFINIIRTLHSLEYIDTIHSFFSSSLFHLVFTEHGQFPDVERVESLINLLTCTHVCKSCGSQHDMYGPL